MIKLFFSYLNANFYLIEQFLDEIIKHLSTDYTAGSDSTTHKQSFKNCYAIHNIKS
jgi:hypothetical protein